MSFSPSSGPVGTVVTVTGSGFSGLSVASVGAQKNASVSVLSDTQVAVTIPAGATSGAIGIFSESAVAFSATAFSVDSATAANASASSEDTGGGGFELVYSVPLLAAALLLRRRRPVPA